MIALAAVVAVVTAAALCWAAAVLFATELGSPTRGVRGVRRAVAVFPHADDEAVTCGGTLHRLAACGARVTLVLLTLGERGTPAGTVDEGLRDVRAAEARRAARILGIAEIVQADLGDGEVRRRGADVVALVGAVLARERPDLVVTYDPAGLYGHDDHVACSELVTELVRTRHPGVALWHVAQPRRLAARVQLDEPLRARRRRPDVKVFVGADLPAKTRALLAYRSQRVPIWLLLALLPYEHYALADFSSTRRNAPT